MYGEVNQSLSYRYWTPDLPGAPGQPENHLIPIGLLFAWQRNAGRIVYRK